MKRIGRVSLYILLGSFIFIQFLRTEKNVSDEVSPFDFLEVNADMPDMLQASFKTSCYDCHSNNTNYPWYAHLAPFSWIIDQHIRNGKSEMNFAGYETLDDRHKIGLLDDICEAVSDSTMPPQNYLMLHRDAILTPEDITAICEWTETEALGIIRKK